MTLSITPVAGSDDAAIRAWCAVSAAATGHDSEKSIPWSAFQQITIVEPEHRGHRLGALIKVENLHYFREAEPTITAIDTFNAARNSHMIAINEAMGFRPLYAFQNWQREI